MLFAYQEISDLFFPARSADTNGAVPCAREDARIRHMYPVPYVAITRRYLALITRRKNGIAKCAVYAPVPGSLLHEVQIQKRPANAGRFLYVPRAGFEPAIYSLRRNRPRPLDERGKSMFQHQLDGPFAFGSF